MTKNKENVIQEYLDEIKKSWTWKLLTENERNKFIFSVEWADKQKLIKGSAECRWKILMALYHSFLSALDYKPIDWRKDTTPITNTEEDSKKYWKNEVLFQLNENYEKLSEETKNIIAEQVMQKILYYDDIIWERINERIYSYIEESIEEAC